jgi:hypothetical protein
MGYLVLMVFLVIEISIFVLSLVAGGKIVAKAGYSGWWILITLVPFVNFVMFLVFAFSKWPVEVRLEAAERPNRQSGPYGWDPYGTGGRAAVGSPPGWGRSSGGSGGLPGPQSWDYMG